MSSKATKDEIGCFVAMMPVSVRSRYEATLRSGFRRLLRGRLLRKTPKKTGLGGQACIMGLNSCDCEIVSEVFAVGGVEHCVYLSQIADLGKLTRLGSSLSHLVINIDIFESIEAAVNFQIGFRKANPAVQIFMISSCVARDDFGSHRTSVCDVTMRAPLSEGRFKAALKAVGASGPMRETGFA